jgi:hypothetical protein
MPESLTSIGDRAFAYSEGLRTITIGNRVTSIGADAFGECKNLAAMTVKEDNPVFSSLDGVLFDKSQTTLLKWPHGKADHYTIPGSVRNIGDEAFARCGSLVSITIGSSVTNIGYHAFSSCTALTSLSIPDSVKSFDDGAFRNCDSLSQISIGGGVTRISDYSFFFCGMTNITIPEGVTDIGERAFGLCTKLNSITMGKRVARIESYAFQGSLNLTGVYFQGQPPAIGTEVFLTADSAIAYYLPGTTGWGSTFAGRPTALWVLPTPVILTLGSGFGVQTNGFGFVISWATNGSVVVDAATESANPAWSPVSTHTLTDGWAYFSDPDWPDYPARLYRLRSP